MQYTALIIAAIGTSTVYAADCYPSSGSQTCLATDDVWALRQAACGGNGDESWAMAGFKEQVFNGKNGHQGLYAGRSVPTQQNCWDTTAQIIDQCFGKFDGGSFTTGNWSTNVNFCA